MDLKTLLLKSSYIYNHNDTCSICQESTDNKLCRQLECNHTYHCECIDKWLSNNNTCPYCRKILSRKNELKPYQEHDIKDGEMHGKCIFYNSDGTIETTS